jgi:hypothetical protein
MPALRGSCLCGGVKFEINGAHIFVASKAPWFEITDDLPQYETVPPPR